MAWRPPEAFGGTLPPAAWPVEAFVMAAMTPQDLVIVISGVLGASGITIGAIGKWGWARWEESNAKQVQALRKELAAEKVRNQDCESDLEAARVEREGSRDRTKAELEEHRAIVAALRVAISEKDRLILAKDVEIHARDTSILQNTRNIDRLSQAVIKLSDSLLVLQGDMRPRAK